MVAKEASGCACAMTMLKPSSLPSPWHERALCAPTMRDKLEAAQISELSVTSMFGRDFKTANASSSLAAALPLPELWDLRWVEGFSCG